MVRTYIDKSHIAGVGVFAAEFVKKDTVVWKFHPAIDIIFTIEQIEELACLPMSEFIESHAIPIPFDADNYCLALDNANYINHSATPNLIRLNQQPGADMENIMEIAAQDIEKGTELTLDYYTQDHRTKELGII